MTSAETSSAIVGDGDTDEVASTGDHKKEKEEDSGQENARTPNHEERYVCPSRRVL